WKCSRNPADDFTSIPRKTPQTQSLRTLKKRERPPSRLRPLDHYGEARRLSAISIFWLRLPTGIRRRSTSTRWPSTSLHFRASIKRWRMERTRDRKSDVEGKRVDDGGRLRGEGE